ncbi:hypothetical protein TNCV_1033791 [Trichonephila clavipes]|nr:hypothetical protein TNCV_1033791 [Trichonephila clavipes]
MQRLPEAIFQQDNARPHTTRVSQDCLHTVTTLLWPARSPDLSAIQKKNNVPSSPLGVREGLKTVQSPPAASATNLVIFMLAIYKNDTGAGIPPS